MFDFKNKLLKEKSLTLRNRLLSKGAKYIICIFDENSNSYQRWHTGHELQKNNYEPMLKELLKNKDLGIIFKPKNAKTLRTRIGAINELLIEAENTGRCYVYDEYTDNFSSAPPVLAGLSF